MKQHLLLFLFAATLFSCSTAYQTGQTPDDVYYSPTRPGDEYVQVKKRDNRQYQGNSEDVREERYLRMRTSYRRYSLLDDYDCYCYTPQSYYRYNDYHRFNSYASFNNTWYNNSAWGYYNPYYYNPYYSNPYYLGYVVGNVRPVYNKPRGGNLGVYNGSGSTYVNTPRKGGTFSTGSNREDNNYRNSGTNAGGFLRNTFGGSNNTSSSSSSNSGSSNSSSGSSSRSSSSSSGSTSAPARKF